MGHLSVDDRVVIGEGNRSVPGGADRARLSPQRRPQVLVVVSSGVAGHPRPPRPDRLLLHTGGVGHGGHNDGSGALDGTARVRGPLGIAVGELHGVGETLGPSGDEFGTGAAQDIGRCDTDSGHTVRGESIADLLDGRERVGASHLIGLATAHRPQRSSAKTLLSMRLAPSLRASSRMARSSVTTITARAVGIRAISSRMTSSASMPSGE